MIDVRSALPSMEMKLIESCTTYESVDWMSIKLNEAKLMIGANRVITYYH